MIGVIVVGIILVISTTGAYLWSEDIKENKRLSKVLDMALRDNVELATKNLEIAKDNVKLAKDNTQLAEIAGRWQKHAMDLEDWVTQVYSSKNHPSVN